MTGDPRAQPPGEGESWSVLRMILWSADYLKKKGVPNPRVDAEHLLADTLAMSRLDLYLAFERPLDPEERAEYKERLLRRASREPLQYIVGSTGFRELELKTDRRALIPRPETEVLVQKVLDWAERELRTGGGRREGERPFRALDVGTGTGAIALSLAEEGPFRVLATDRSADAAELARENAELLALADWVEVREGSFFTPVDGEGPFDVVVSNPPYVAEAERNELAPELTDWEPEGALFAGSLGMDVLDPLIEEVATHLRPGGLLALEIGADQARRVVERIGETGAFDDAEVAQDWTGRDRVVLARRSSGAGGRPEGLR